MIMELTQRIECTQDLFERNERTSSEQIGFLGICGQKYPIKKGPNKIGRDPESCNIVLNLNSISRQHAVINILNSHDFMLMDLDSANKTKLSDKTLDAYIPYPLKHGDMVQFGQVFGVFRLFKEENDLPMTQAIEIPDTPGPIRHVSKLNNYHTTTIPESPDVSDKDDSFIASSQTKSRNVFKSPNNNFLISSGKTVSIKPIGTNKIDNVYWSSSKKSDSFSTQSDVTSNLNYSVSLSTSHTAVAKQNIHELNTQLPYSDHNEAVQSNNNTQITGNAKQNIYDMETQMAEIYNCQADNKENDNNIFNADTQVICDVKSGSARDSKYLNNEQTEGDTKVSPSKDNHNVSDDVILFDEIDSQLLQNDFYSQPILSPKLNLAANDRQPKADEKEAQSEKNSVVSDIKANHLESDSSTDCEDIFMAKTQEIPKATDIDENSTDCDDEPNPFESLKSNKNLNNSPVIDDDVTDCEDELNEIDVIRPNKPLKDDRFEDLPTQILEEEKVDVTREYTSSVNNENSILAKTPIPIVEDINDLLHNCNGNINIDIVSKKQFHAEFKKDFAEALTQQIHSEEMVKFKVPFPSPLTKNNSDDINTNIDKCTTTPVIVDDDDDQYYNATQELFNDLCSQRTLSPEVSKSVPKKKSSEELTELSDASDVETRIDNFVTNLSYSQIREVVGVQTDLGIHKKVLSDMSDLEMTPKKINCRAILDTNLPNTQEIKSATHYSSNNSDTDSSCNSNESNNERDIPKRIHQKTKRNSKIKINLSEKFDPASLPVRSSSRLKKQTEKLRNTESLKKTYENLSKIRSHKKCHTTAKNDKNDNKKDKKADYEISRSMTIQDNKTDKININKRKAKSVETFAEELNNEQDSTTGTYRKTRSQKSNITQNISEDKETKVDNKFKRKDNRKPIKEKAESPDNEQSKSTLKSIIKKPSKDVVKHETEVRRSKRNKSGKKSEESSSDIPKTKSSNREQSTRCNTESSSDEQSAVYSSVATSSGSGTDSPNRLKRLATEGFGLPNAKKYKTGYTNDSSSYRATPARKIKTHYVLLTAFPSADVKHKLETLGAIIVSDVMSCTVVLTQYIKRTSKLLCAVGLGKPIVGTNWVQACSDANMIVDPWLYLIEDEATERRYQFNLRSTILGKRGYLMGYNISSTPSVMPTADVMKLIVECSGGNWKEGRNNWICVSTSADRALWAGLRRKGAVIVSSEFILAGVLRQKLDIDKNKLI